jgi:benzylsuccinate CoA-transferase BbsE subunit
LKPDVSAQEAVAQALEDTVAQFALTGHARDRRGDRPQEAGTGIYRCADGHVGMVAGRLGTARAWKALAEWLSEEGIPGADALADEPWSNFDFRRSQEGIDGFAAIFGSFAAARSMESLYREAQRRGIALSPVNDLAGLLADRQLAAREFFVEVEDEALGQVVFPGAPYRLSHSPPRQPESAHRRGREAIALFTGGSGDD